ncbi:MAG: hypothetical protein M0Q91_17340 [Methanoregula sp.]|jgi:hypothetical protein|nr:hypothetical protein [Methanoregula sp.]
MPLLKGQKNIGKNILELEGTGRSHRQSVAIALRVAGVGRGPGGNGRTGRSGRAGRSGSVR